MQTRNPAVSISTGNFLVKSSLQVKKAKAASATLAALFCADIILSKETRENSHSQQLHVMSGPE